MKISTESKTNEIKRGDLCRLAIPAARPIKVLSGALFTSDDKFKFLNVFNGCMLRLSRIGDNAKLIILPEEVIKIS